MYCLTIKYTKRMIPNTVVTNSGKSEIFCKIKHIAQDVMNRRLQNLLSSYIKMCLKYIYTLVLCKQDKFDEFISPMKGYLRETCKSQNINPIYLTLSSPAVSFRS